MLLSHRHRLVFIKTKKTAGTSVEIYLERACLGLLDEPAPADEMRDELVTDALVIGRRGADTNPANWWNHMPAEVVKRRMGRLWDDYLKVCCVRDPFDRMVSAFWMRQPEARRRELQAADFVTVREAFKAWLERRGGLMLYDHICNIDGEFALDRVIRYERLHEDLAEVCGQVGLPWRPSALGAYKGAIRVRPERFDAYYDAETTAEVRDLCAFEIAEFGYPSTPG